MANRGTHPRCNITHCNAASVNVAGAPFIQLDDATPIYYANWRALTNSPYRVGQGQTTDERAKVLRVCKGHRDAGRHGHADDAKLSKDDRLLLARVHADMEAYVAATARAAVAQGRTDGEDHPHVEDLKAVGLLAHIATQMREIHPRPPRSAAAAALTYVRELLEATVPVDDVVALNSSNGSSEQRRKAVALLERHAVVIQPHLSKLVHWDHITIVAQSEGRRRAIKAKYSKTQRRW